MLTEEEKKKSRGASSMKYNAANTIQFKCCFNKKTDSDIIEHLETVGNKQGYIKKLIREDINN